MGILLSADDNQMKANLMFQLYDKENTKNIQIESVRDLFERILAISIRYLPMLVPSTTGKYAELKDYLSLLESLEEQVIGYILQFFRESSVAFQSFTEFISQEAVVLSPIGIRNFTKGLKICLLYTSPSPRDS